MQLNPGNGTRSALWHMYVGITVLRPQRCAHCSAVLQRCMAILRLKWCVCVACRCQLVQLAENPVLCGCTNTTGSSVEECICLKAFYRFLLMFGGRKL